MSYVDLVAGLRKFANDYSGRDSQADLELPCGRYTRVD